MERSFRSFESYMWTCYGKSLFGKILCAWKYENKGGNFSFLLLREREKEGNIFFILFLNWFVFDTFKQVCWYSTILHMNFCYDIVVWSLFRMMLINFFINFLLVIFISIIDIPWNTVIFCFHLLIFFYLLCWKFLSKFYNNRHLISCLNYCIFTFFTTVK